MKPFVTYEDRIYNNLDSLVYVSRKKQKLLDKPYKSALIEDLSNAKIELSNELNELLLEAVEVFSKLDGYVKDKFLSFPNLLLRTEALSSSQIEFYSASNRNIAIAQLKGKVGQEAKIISGNLEALISSLERNKRITVEYITEINKEVLNANHSEIRKVINWISKPGQFPQEATYVPPHPEYLDKYMNEFIKFIERDDVHPLVLAAFAHAYFEIIHPFEDGNGRTGRILIQLILKQKKFLENINIPFSTGLVENEKLYIDSLDEFKEGKYEKIISLILESGLSVVNRIYKALNEMIALKESWVNRIVARKDALVWKIIDDILMQPVIDVKYIKEKHKANDQAVRNNLNILIEANIISQIGNSKRDVYYETKEVLDILDNF